jgi:hypothetical protein
MPNGIISNEPDPTGPGTVLRVGGVTVATGTTGILPQSLLLYNLDGPDEFQFVERPNTLTYPATYNAHQLVEVWIDGVRRFLGKIENKPERWSDGEALAYLYRCFGLKWVANRVPITANSGLGEFVFNLPPNDLFYIEDEAGLTIGEMIRRVLTVPATANALVAEDVTAYTTFGPFTALNPPILKPQTLTDLALLNIVPIDPVRFAGSKLWNAIETNLQDWMPSIASVIYADGTIRFKRAQDFQTVTLTMGLTGDPIDRPSLSYEAGDCYTRVVVRGWYDAEGVWLSTADGTLVEDFTPGTTYSTNAAAKAAWNYRFYTEPRGGYDEGTITSVSATSVTVKSSTSTRTWGANRWSKDKAVATVINPILLGQGQYWETRRVVSNTPLVANGTSVLTFDYPLNQNQFSKYKLVGRSDPEALIYRRYAIPDAYVRDRIVPRFPLPYPMSTVGGSTTWVTTPVGIITRAPATGQPGQEFPAWFDMWTDIYDGNERKVVFSEPVVKAWNSAADLNTGGSAVKVADEVKVFVPVAKDGLRATRPAAGFEGLAYTNDGIESTLFLDVPSWRYRGDQTMMELYAQQILDVVKDPVIAGSIRYLGKYNTAITTPMIAVNVASDAGTTGHESMAATVRSVLIEWPSSGPLNNITTLNVSTRRQPWTGDRLFLPYTDFAGGDMFAGGAVSAEVSGIFSGEGFGALGVSGIMGGGGFDMGGMDGGGMMPARGDGRQRGEKRDPKMIQDGTFFASANDWDLAQNRERKTANERDKEANRENKTTQQLDKEANQGTLSSAEADRRRNAAPEERVGGTDDVKTAGRKRRPRGGT